MRIGIYYTPEEREHLYQVREALLDIEQNKICDNVDCPGIDCIQCPLWVLRNTLADIIDDFESIITKKVG